MARILYEVVSNPLCGYVGKRTMYANFFDNLALCRHYFLFSTRISSKAPLSSLSAAEICATIRSHCLSPLKPLSRINRSSSFFQYAVANAICTRTYASSVKPSSRTVSSDVSAVKLLREQTGLSIGRCKEALVKFDGDIDEAKKFLRKSTSRLGGGSLAKDVASEGIVCLHRGERFTCLLKFCCESDFVTRDSLFQKIAFSITSFTAFLASKLDNPMFRIEDQEILEKVDPKIPDLRISDLLNTASNIFGEHLRIDKAFFIPISTNNFLVAKNRIAGGEPERSLVSSAYLHGKIANECDYPIGRSGSLVGISCSARHNETLQLNKGALEVLQAVAKHLAMQLVALPVRYLSKNCIDDSTVQEERRIIRETSKCDKMSEEVMKKRLDSGISKFIKDNTLLGQSYLMFPQLLELSKSLLQQTDDEGQLRLLNEFQEAVKSYISAEGKGSSTPDVSRVLSILGEKLLMDINISAAASMRTTGDDVILARDDLMVV